MKHVVEKRFLFLANAVALAAHIRRPEDLYVPAVASSCLPVTGGVGNAAVEGGSFGDVVSYRSAATHVSGGFEDETEPGRRTETTTESRLAGLRIVNGARRVEAGLLETKMSASSERARPPRFHLLSAEFRDVSVDGVGLRVETHCDLFAEHSTKQKLAEAFASSQEFRDRYGAFFFSERPVNRRRRKLPDSGGVTLGTIVTRLEWEGAPPEGAEIRRNSVVIRGFGAIYFGELLIEEGFRRLTLLRFELRSPAHGEGAVVEIQSNGTTWPPHRH